MADGRAAIGEAGVELKLSIAWVASVFNKSLNADVVAM
jgi:hypothetical protein